MNNTIVQFLKTNLNGDRYIWAVVALLAIFSFIPVYSASSNLAYLNGGSGNTLSYLIKHFIHLFMGLIIIFGVHKIQFKYFRGISILLLPIAIILLIITALKGTTIDGSYASRWLTIPVVNMSFQTSSFASIVLMVYVARYLSRIAGKPIRFKDTILPLWIPVFIVVGLIFPSNFSTAAIIFSMVLLIAFLSGYPIKYSAVIVGFSLSAFILFIAISKAFPGLLPNRVDTWTSRIENFLPNDNSEKEEDEPYQVRESKIAIATGGINGKGIGKSVQRNFLPQSSSDFIYAIIIEETGLIGGFFVLFIYLYLLLRIAIIFTKNESLYGKLLVAAVGLPIIFQAFINIGVAVNLFPVTGQTLPLISSGGSSIWMTCVGLGIILSVSAKNNKDYTEKELKYTKEEQENPLDVLSQTL
jgi:cell division protein FtsW